MDRTSSSKGQWTNGNRQTGKKIFATLIKQEFSCLLVHCVRPCAFVHCPLDLLVPSIAPNSSE
ncbi:MAG: hypothetical protein WCF65_00530 [Parachlamydiaceae bacterium]